MKKTKLLCAVLIACMLFTMLPFLSFAAEYANDEAAAADGMVAKIGETYYAAFVDAVNAAADGDTILLIADVKDVADQAASFKGGKTVTLDAQNHTISGQNYPIKIEDANLTVKNAKIDAPRGFRVQTNQPTASSLTLENCTVNITAGGTFRVDGENRSTDNPEFVLTVRDSDIYSSAADAVLWATAGAVIHVVVEDSTIEHACTSTASDVAQQSIFSLSNFAKVTIDLKGDAVLRSAGNNTVPDSYIVNAQTTTASSVVLNLDETARIEMAPANQAKTMIVPIIAKSANTTVTLNDAGATWFYSKAAYEQGAYFPSITPAEGQAGWLVNNAEYSFALAVNSLKKLPEGLNAANGVILKLALGDTPIEDTIGTDAEAAAAGYVCRIGQEGSGTYYATLEAAIQAVEKDGTIVVIANASGGAVPQISGKTFTLDGNSCTLTLSGDAFTIHDSHVTVKNLTLHATGGVAFVLRVEKNDNKNDNEDGVSLVLDNCVVEAAKMVFKHQTAAGGPQGTHQSVTIKNGSVITSGLDDLMLSNDTGVGGQIVEYTIDNSTLQTLGGNNNVNNRMFIVGGGKEKHTVINVVNGGRLIGSTGTMSGSGSKPENILFGIDKSAGSMTINLDDTATLELAPGSTAKTNNRFCNFTGTSTVTLNDEGAVWKFSKAAVEQGAYYPGFSNTNILGWAIGGGLHKPVAASAAGQIAKTTAADEGLTIRPIFLNPEDFVMVNGASIRTADPTGIRFATKVSSDLINTLTEAGVTVEFGTYITLTSKLQALNVDFETFLGIYPATVKPEENGTEWIKVVSTKWAQENENGMNEYRACLYNIPASKTGYTTAFSAMSYFMVSYADGSSQTYYTAYDEADHSRSMLEVAEAAIADGKGNDYLQSIVDACD